MWGEEREMDGGGGTEALDYEAARAFFLLFVDIYEETYVSRCFIGSTIFQDALLGL